MKSTDEKIEEIKSHGYELDFGTVFNHAFEIYKKIALSVGVSLLLFSMLVCIIVAGLVVGILGVGISGEEMQQFSVVNFSPLGIVAYVVFMVAVTALGSPFTAGLTKMARNASKDEEVAIGNAFDYYGGPYFSKIVLASLVMASFTTLVDVGLELIDYKMLGVGINLVVSLLTFLTIPLIIFGNLDPMNAIKGSIIIISKQFLIIIGLLIVTGLFCMLGIFGFCIGIFFTLPLINAMTYSIYASILDDHENENQAEMEQDENDVILE
jgi:hypothetical protein